MKNLGQIGEDLAAAFLKKQKYKIIDRNFRIRGGEIDIIALDGKTLVYIEVKTRTSHRFGTPAQSVTPAKISFLIRAAKFYRNSHQNLPEGERIDVVTVDFSNSTRPKIEHIPNVTL
ncbi:MAG: YraN family protein [Candidatus Curtissbacteria bacterium]